MSSFSSRLRALNDDLGICFGSFHLVSFDLSGAGLLLDDGTSRLTLTGLPGDTVASLKVCGHELAPFCCCQNIEALPCSTSYKYFCCPASQRHLPGGGEAQRTGDIVSRNSIELCGACGLSQHLRPSTEDCCDLIRAPLVNRGIDGWGS